MPFFRIFDDFQRFLAIFVPFLVNFDQFLMILSHFCSFLRILGRDFQALWLKFSKIFRNFPLHLVFIGVTNRFISSDRQQIKSWSKYNQFFFWG
jgi:hypothetical protein